MLNGPEHLERVSGIVSFFLLNFLTISSLGLFASLAIRYWNRPTKANQSLAANSYSMYLTHYVFVLVFQLVLFTFPGISGLIKFGTVSGLSIVCSYLVSRFLVTPFPRIAVAGAIGLFIVMSLVIHSWYICEWIGYGKPWADRGWPERNQAVAGRTGRAQRDTYSPLTDWWYLAEILGFIDSQFIQDLKHK